MLMYINNDLYEILQIHPKAEAEIIKATYRRLSMKYHPDKAEQGSEEKMKLLNYAYSILGDTLKRKEYDMEYLKTQRIDEYAAYENLEKSKSEARKTLFLYLSFLASQKLNDAYFLITDNDKRHISLKAFCEWQKAVGSVFEILDFELEYNQRIILEEDYWQDAYGFAVTITEKEKKTIKVKEYNFFRTVVKEDNHYRVLLDYRDVKEFTKSFKLRNRKRVAARDFEYIRNDLINEISKEIARADRYKKNFSLVIIEISIGNYDLGFECNTESQLDLVLKECLNVLRATDIIGRFGEYRLLALLPETKLLGSTKATSKMFSVIKQLEQASKINQGTHSYAGIIEYNKSSVSEMLDIAIVNLLNAKKKGAWSMTF